MGGKEEVWVVPTAVVASLGVVFRVWEEAVAVVGDVNGVITGNIGWGKTVIDGLSLNI